MAIRNRQKRMCAVKSRAGYGMLRFVVVIFWIVVAVICSLFTATGNGVPRKSTGKKKLPRKPRTPKRPKNISTQRRNVVGAIVVNGKFVNRIYPSVIVEYADEITIDNVRAAFVRGFQEFIFGKKITENDVKKSGERLYVDIGDGAVVWFAEWHSSERCRLCGGLPRDRAEWCPDNAFHNKPQKITQKKRISGF